MKSQYTITLDKIIKEFTLEQIYIPRESTKIEISSMEVDRPGLALAGFFEMFTPQRIQIIGRAEHKYLSELTSEERSKCIGHFFARSPVAVIYTSALSVHDEVLRMAEENAVPILRTSIRTSEYLASLIAYLNTNLAPRITRHGVLVEVYGEGILILGDSGVGKSETAIELVKRGHRLIADDAVEIKRVSSKTLLGTAPELIRYYVELRGIGVVDVRRLFGMGSVKDTERIDLVINLEQWQPDKMYERFGLDDQFENILGIDIPALTIPVHSGRNLAIVIEIAAMNNRQKKMGYNTPEEFNKRLMELTQS